MAEQDLLWRQEADAWYRRNRTALTYEGRTATDPMLRLLQANPIQPKVILDVGCSTGWRLAYLAKQYGALGLGVDLSAEAIAEGRRLYPNLELFQQSALDLPCRDGEAELVVCSFLLHCLARESLLSVVAEVDRALAPGGHLLLNDFSPDVPSRRAWEHRPGLWTYKLPMAGENLFLSTGLYRELRLWVYDHDTGEACWLQESGRRAAAVLLVKEDQYR